MVVPLAAELRSWKVGFGWFIGVFVIKTDCFSVSVTVKVVSFLKSEDVSCCEVATEDSLQVTRTGDGFEVLGHFLSFLNLSIVSCDSWKASISYRSSSSPGFSFFTFESSSSF